MTLIDMRNVASGYISGAGGDDGVDDGVDDGGGTDDWGGSDDSSSCPAGKYAVTTTTTGYTTVNLVMTDSYGGSQKYTVRNYCKPS